MKSKYAANDLRARLDGSIIRYKGEPVYVRVDGSNLILYKLEDAAYGEPIATVSGNDTELDVSTVPLGYANRAGNAYYIVREPTRRYKQGIDQQSISIKSVDGSANGRAGINLCSKPMADCIKGVYPTYAEAFKQLRSGKAISVAFSRDVAVSIDSLGIIRVHFKSELVGWIAPNSNKVNVPSSNVGWVISYYLDGFAWEID